MKLKDLLNAINEMAMTNYGRYGDFNKSDAFPNKKDQEFIQSEKHPIRIENAFKNVKQDINCYFVADHIFSYGEKPIEKLHQYIDVGTENYRQMHTEILKNYKNSITFIFAGNRDENGFVGKAKATPPTGWAMAHKVGHMMVEQPSTVSRDSSKLMDKIFLILIDSEVELDSMAHLDKMRIMNKLVPSASGRNGKIVDEIEFAIELLTIWIWYGAARVGDISNETFTTQYGEDFEIDSEQGTNIKDKIEQIINKTMPKIFDKMVGKIYIVPQ